MEESEGGYIFESTAAQPHYFMNPDKSKHPLEYWKYKLIDDALEEYFEGNPIYIEKAIEQHLTSLFNSHKDEPRRYTDKIDILIFGERTFNIPEYLTKHYKEYTDFLMADENGQLFFDFLINFSETRKSKLYLKSFKALRKWVQEHPDYTFPKSALVTPDSKTSSLYDHPNELSLRQIALILVLQGYAVESKEAKKLMENGMFNSWQKMIQYHSDYKNNKIRKLKDLNKTHRREAVKNLRAVVPYLIGKERKDAENELKSVGEEIKQPV